MDARIKEVPIEMVGSSKFGIDPKINIEKTYNCIISDNALINYSGFKAIINTGINGKGRGEFSSIRLGKTLSCIGSSLFSVDQNDNYTRIAILQTSSGDVFFAENEKKEIAICDKLNIYIYNYQYGTFVIAEESNGNPLDFRPGYITYQNGRFITVALQTNDSNAASWRLGSLTSSNYFPSDSQSIGLFQTKGDSPLACFPIPGGGNTFIVMGSISGEVYYNVANAALFPYQRSTNSSLDYGLTNSATLDFSDTFAVWLGYNEKSAPVVMFSDGGNPQSISTDGIDHKMQSVKNPQKSFGFLIRQNGHWIYQFTFYDPQDNFSLLYDFKTQKFFNVSDENMNYHPAKKVSYLNNQYYFVSFNDNKIYKMSPDYTTYDYGSGKEKEIPRIRICNYIRQSNTMPFITRYINFPIFMGNSGRYNSISRIVILNGGSGYTEATIKFSQGSGFNAKAEAVIVDGVITEINVINPGQQFLDDPLVIIEGDGEGAEAIAVINRIAPRVDLSISNDGGVTFSNNVNMFMNPLAVRKNRFAYYQLGWSNEMVPQFRLWSFDKFAIGNGVAGIVS